MCARVSRRNVIFFVADVIYECVRTRFAIAADYTWCPFALWGFWGIRKVWVSEKLIDFARKLMLVWYGRLVVVMCVHCLGY